MIKTASTLFLLAISSLVWGQKQLALGALEAAYPDAFLEVNEREIIWKDGSRMPFDDGRTKTFLQLLTAPDLEDQIAAMPYPRGLSATPLRGEDPGRVRYEPFFKKMYGASAAEVRKNLKTVIWLPKTLGIKLQITKVNGVADKLQALSNRLDTMPHLHKYLQNPGGTFNWRKIAGTNRQSMHSFGMTIDINVAYSNYWRWAVKGNDPEGKRIIAYKNRIPMELVLLFEEYGFIWGGKWYHYDTMHFEYRPELLQKMP